MKRISRNQVKRNLVTLMLGLSLPFSFSCLTSCTASIDEKAQLHKVEKAEKTFYLSSVEQLNTVCRYDDALILVTLPGCEYCAKQREFLNSYILETEALVYEVSRDTYVEAYDEETNQTGNYAYLLPRLTGYPSFLSYSEGKLLKAQKGALGDDYQEFHTNIDAWVDVNNVYQINDYTEQNVNSYDHYLFDTPESMEETKMIDSLGYGTEKMDEAIQKTGSKTIYYSWRRCNDCKSFRQNGLREYFHNLEKKIYYYEVDGYFLLKRNSDESLMNLGLKLYSDFCIKYHLSDYPNIDANGNLAGYVPTIVSYQADSSYAISVYSNQGDLTIDEEGKLYYAKSFYPEISKLRSDTKLSADEEQTSDNYQKALSELKQKKIPLDAKLNLAFLDEHL